MKTHLNVDQEEFKKYASEKVDSIANSVSILIDKVEFNDEDLRNKLQILAENGDHINDVQRQVIEKLDKRIEDLENAGSIELMREVKSRLCTMEIKVEKLLS